jgi:hypothetical protein
LGSIAQTEEGYMGRYVLLWVDDTEKVEPVIERLSQWSVVRVVGLFVEPTKFCDKSCGRQTGDAWSRAHPLIVHPVWGTKHCPLCKRAVRFWAHTSLNGLDPKGLPMKMRHLRLQIFDEEEPVQGRGVTEYFGKKVVKAAIQAETATRAVTRGYTATAERRRATRARRRARKAA